MRQNVVLTLTGPDRIGIVESVAKTVLDHGGNVETSRMARLSGEFAILMLASAPTERIASLEEKLGKWRASGYKVTVTPAEKSDPGMRPGWLPYRIELQGADHEGIVHQVAHYLSQRGINIEEMETETVHASVSGAQLFMMTARVAAPPSLQGQDWTTALEEVGQALNVDIEVTPGDGE